MNSGIVFQVGPVVVHWYGLLIVVAAILGGSIGVHEARRHGENPGHVWFGLPWCVVFGFMGARLDHILSTPADGSGGLHYYLENPIAALRVWDGGLGIYGAIGGAVLAVWLYTRRYRLLPWRWLDIGAPGLVLGQALVRWANLINQELYGPPTRVPWGIPIEAVHRIPRYADLTRYPVETTRFHPSFLYESLWSLAVFAVLVWAGRRWADRLHAGDVFLTYLALFGLGRLWIVQFFRPDAWRLANGLAVGTLIAFVLVLAAEAELLRRHPLPRVTVPGVRQQQ